MENIRNNSHCSKFLKFVALCHIYYIILLSELCITAVAQAFLLEKTAISTTSFLIDSKAQKTGLQDLEMSVKKWSTLCFLRQCCYQLSGPLLAWEKLRVLDLEIKKPRRGLSVNSIHWQVNDYSYFKISKQSSKSSFLYFLVQL